ncbi:MAG: Ca-activated chloride channel [Chloroflexota bacterium]|jgi:Ca-activated chloride channel family protein|nr:Ca-activated chloride channel [Chloroflexota bacterium]
MTFADPILLVGLLIVPAALLVYRVVQRRRSRYAVRFTNVDLLGNLVPRTPAWRRHVPPAFYVVAMAALVLALARPSLAVQVPREEATIILTMDVSGSMMATDVDPTRLAAAKQAASDFVDQLPASVRIGLVAFSTSPRLVVAATTDRAAVHAGIDGLQSRGGTALGDAIATSLDAAGLDRTTVGSKPPAPSAVPSAPVPSAAPLASADPSASGDPAADAPVVAMVLLSDGANSTGDLEPIPAAEMAAALNVPIYTIALGTAGGVVTVPDDTGRMRTLNVPPDTETLAQIAELTGARSFEAPTAQDLAQIYDSLGSRIGYTTETQEVTQWFAAAALVLVVAGAGLAAHWFNRFP